MKGHLGMNIVRTMLLAVVLVAAACGGEQSVASRSAEAYREAQATGTAGGGGHDHGGSAAPQTAGGPAPAGDGAVDHSAHSAGAGVHAGMDHGAPAGGTMDHSAHGSAAGIDHAAMGHGTSTGNAHSGHGPTRGAADHSAMGHSAGAANAHSGHDTSAGPTPTDHSAMGHGSSASTNAQAQRGTTAATPNAPQSNAEMRRMEPSATLRGDSFDAAAPVAVSEAARAAQGGGHEGHQTRGITPGEDQENPPTPMPATRDQSTNAPATDHSQHRPAATTVYTCPMHPEVTSDQPGTCPKCGMALVKK